MRIPIVRETLRVGSILVAVTTLVHGAVSGAALAMHLAAHDHAALDHDRQTAIALIVHGHEHETGTPEHRHSVMAAKPARQHLKRQNLPVPPFAASHQDSPSTPTIVRSLRLRTDLCGPSPPSLGRSLVVLRI